MRLDHSICIRVMETLSKRCCCKNCQQMFRRSKCLIKHLNEVESTGDKEKSIFLQAESRYILNSFGKVFVVINTIFIYTTCKSIETQPAKIGKSIHQKMSWLSKESRVKVWVLDRKAEKTPAYYSVDEYNNFMDITGIIYFYEK